MDWWNKYISACAITVSVGSYMLNCTQPSACQIKKPIKRLTAQRQKVCAISTQLKNQLCRGNEKIDKNNF